MEETIEKLKRIKARKVFVQFPEGLRLRVQNIAKQLEKEGIAAILCCEPCYGSCDVRDEEASRLGCDAVLHIGHERMVQKTKLPVIYWEYFIGADALPILEKNFETLKEFKRIGLATSIQFVETIPAIKKFLEKKGKKVFVHKSLQYPGQILGCNLDAAKKIENKVDCFLCISAGKFYGLGMVFATEKPMLNLDLEKGEIYSLDDFKRKVQKIIAWNESQLKDAKKVGILLSWKKGQFKQDAFKLKKELEKQGKEVYMLAMDEITPEKLEGLKLDAAINLACPRIGIDDLEKYKIPIVNYDRFKY